MSSLRKTSMNNLRKNVFYPPLLLIICTILFSQINNDLFSTSISKLNTWILEKHMVECIGLLSETELKKMNLEKI